MRTFSMESCRKMINENKSKPITLKVLRGRDTLMIQPVVNDSGMIGITYKSDFGTYPMTEYSLVSAIAFGSSDAMEAITSNIKGLKQIFAGIEKASDS